MVVIKLLEVGIEVLAIGIGNKADCVLTFMLKKTVFVVLVEQIDRANNYFF